MHPTRAAARQTQAAEASAQAIADMQHGIAVLLERSTPLALAPAELVSGPALATQADLARVEAKIDALIEQLTGTPTTPKRGTHGGQ
jgi:hypothetical protein